MRRVGRYALFDKLAAGGQAVVCLGRLSAAHGFARTVAIKCLHPGLASEPELVALFLDEARLAARVRHPNVVPVIDVVAEDGEVMLVMEYIEGESLSKLRRAEGALPVALAAGIVRDALRGLHAAHEARNEEGAFLGLVHRDISPQNILVGVDGVSRVLDFGIAKALGRTHQTAEGQIRGKLSYMAPEQLRGEPVDRRTDLFAAGVVLWEALTGKPLFTADEPTVTSMRVLTMTIQPPSAHAPDVAPDLDAIVLKALKRNAKERFATADDMANALEAACTPAPTRTVGEWVRRVAADDLAKRAAIVQAVETARFGEKPPESEVAEERSLQNALETTRLERPRRRPRRAAWVVVGLVAAGSGVGITLAARGRTRADIPAIAASAPVASSAPSNPVVVPTTPASPIMSAELATALPAPSAATTVRATRRAPTAIPPPTAVATAVPTASACVPGPAWRDGRKVIIHCP